MRQILSFQHQGSVFPEVYFHAQKIIRIPVHHCLMNEAVQFSRVLIVKKQLLNRPACGRCICVCICGQHILKFPSYCQVTSLYDDGVRVCGIHGFEVSHVASPHSFFHT